MVTMRIVVFGAGGVGGYFGGRLVEAGHDVVFVARGGHLDALRNTGISITSPRGPFAGKVQATSDPKTIGRADLILMATKAWQVREAAAAVQPAVDSHTTVLPLQNGVEAAEHIAEVLGAERVIGGLCRILSQVTAPGEILHVGADPTIVFGELDRSSSARCREIRDALSEAPGMQVEIADDIHVALWQKLLLMAPTSGLSSVTRAPLGVLRSLPETRELLQRAMEEVVRLAHACKVAVDPNAVAATLSFIDTLPPESTPSMHRDILEGRPSELESQTGGVARLGRTHDVDVPVNTFLYLALLPLELAARGKITFAT
jgi:2-dehydropantoate 2-reductase